MSAAIKPFIVSVGERLVLYGDGKHRKKYEIRRAPVENF